MQQTSFGNIKFLSQEPFIEWLCFEKSGRPHQHEEYELFVTTKGTGLVIKGDKEVRVEPGTIVSIPPNTDHWMVPDEGQNLEGFLSYYKSEPKFE